VLCGWGVVAVLGWWVGGVLGGHAPRDKIPCLHRSPGGGPQVGTPGFVPSLGGPGLDSL